MKVNNFLNSHLLSIINLDKRNLMNHTTANSMIPLTISKLLINYFRYKKCVYIHSTHYSLLYFQWPFSQSKYCPPIFVIKYKRRFPHLLVTVGDVADLIPRKGALGCQSVVRLVDVQTQGVHSQKKICSLFILNHISKVNNAFIHIVSQLRNTCDQLLDKPCSQHSFIPPFDRWHFGSTACQNYLSLLS